MNNDRFKFRVWDNEQNKYRQDNVILFKEGDPHIALGGYYFYEHNCTIEQCTGLRDRKGKLIYEGDIVATDNAELVVEWYRAGWWGHNHLWCSLTPLAGLVVEVVGNIHEVKHE